jgi:hypothetical protein
VASWINLIKQVKSSDVEEIRAAYTKALPFVVHDWAVMVLRVPKARRLDLLEKIDKVHGEHIRQMVRDKVIVLHKLRSHNPEGQTV